jgi:hypothetical protein
VVVLANRRVYNHRAKLVRCIKVSIYKEYNEYNEWYNGEGINDN